MDPTGAKYADTVPILPCLVRNDWPAAHPGSRHGSQTAAINQPVLSKSACGLGLALAWVKRLGFDRLELAGEELRASEPKRPIFVCIRHESDEDVAWCDAACSLQLLHQRSIERFLHNPTARTGRHLKDQHVRSSHDTETRILNDHSGWRMLSNNLIAIAIGHIE